MKAYTDKAHGKILTGLEIILVAGLYFVTAKIGQIFAIPPGNITPIWLPSGLMVAIIIVHGYRLWPGIFLGAFIGNVWAYLLPFSSEHLLKACISGMTNGIGDVLATTGSIYIFRRRFPVGNPFENSASFKQFAVWCALAGSLLSAICGVTSLTLTGFLSWDSYLTALLTWWTGDSVGVLLVASLCLSFYFAENEPELKKKIHELIAYAFIFSGLCAALLHHADWPAVIPSPIFFTLPVLLWSVLHFGFRITFTSIFIIAALAVQNTSEQIGPFSGKPQLFALIELQLFLTLLVTSVIAVGIVVADRNRLLHNLQSICNHDLLTGVYSRYYFTRLIEAEAERSARYKSNWCLIMIDIDHFKLINDDFGHTVGDQVLQRVTHLISLELREVDSLGRWGGEEFLILMPNTTLSGGFQFAERCRHKIEQHQFNLNRPVTISLGVIQPEMGVSVQDILHAVDKTMYQSKQEGRNRTSINDNTWYGPKFPSHYETQTP